jgi:hypothetical protein
MEFPSFNYYWVINANNASLAVDDESLVVRWHTVYAYLIMFPLLEAKRG